MVILDAATTRNFYTYLRLRNLAITLEHYLIAQVYRPGCGTESWASYKNSDFTLKVGVLLLGWLRTLSVNH